jgi:hypothetical protein
LPRQTALSKLPSAVPPQLFVQAEAIRQVHAKGARAGIETIAKIDPLGKPDTYVADFLNQIAEGDTVDVSEGLHNFFSGSEG